jgi:hypothetical protein
MSIYAMLLWFINSCEKIERKEEPILTIELNKMKPLIYIRLELEDFFKAQ